MSLIILYRKLTQIRPSYDYELNCSHFSLFLIDKTDIEKKIINRCLFEVLKNVDCSFHKSSYEDRSALNTYILTKYIWQSIGF